MRNALCSALVECATDPRFVFLTGDLGFAALEPLMAAAGPRFINAGVAEQNMVSVAAGIAATGLSPWVYSIAPFAYARPFEQIRNDVCIHNLPVKLVGNGGGYGYGVMGATHHALEDYGVLLALQNMRAFVPAFAADVAPVISTLMNANGPCYLRLGRCEKPAALELGEYAPWRRLSSGDGSVILVVGPLAGPIIGAAEALPESERPTIWVLTELPIAIKSMPAEFLADIRRVGRLLVAEEHVAQGSAGQAIALTLLTHSLAPVKFAHHCATGYATGRYGSQQFHRLENGLDACSVLAGARFDG